MSTLIHPTAIIDPKAKLAEGVSVGPYAIIGEHVTIGKGTQIDAFAQIMGYTTVGENCHIYSYAVIGSPPQDLKFLGAKSYLFIGNNNTLREFVTVNPGTEEGSSTIIGNDNLFMGYGHIAHNCVIGDSNVLANGATLAGHVTLGTRVVLGGLVAIHQFCRVGDLSIIGGCSKVVQDIPPYSLSDGHPAKVYGLNSVGLKRAQINLDSVKLLKKAFKIIFFQNHSLMTAQNIIKEQFPQCKEITNLLDFLARSQRGVAR